MRRLAAYSLFLFAVLCATGCTVRYANAVYGTDVQQKIDENIAPMLRSYDPSLKIAPAQCDSVIPLSHDLTGRCTLAVDGVPLDIHVTSEAPPKFNVDFGGAYFFEMAKLEQMAQRDLYVNHAVRAVVHCGNPRVRLLQPGTTLTCTVAGSPVLKSMAIKTLANGNVLFPNPPGLKATSAIPDSLLTLHKQGAPVVAGGRDVEAFITQVFAVAQNGAHVVAHCPGSLDLTGHRRGVCTVPIRGLQAPQRLAVWIEDDRGIMVRPIDIAIDRSKLQNLAQAGLNRRLADNGHAAKVVVHCPAGLALVTPPMTFDCPMTVSGKRYKLVVTIKDFKGTATWRGVPVGT